MVAFQLKYSLSPFLFLTFSTLNSFWFVFFQFFFVKSSRNYVAYNITDKICPRNSVFKLFNHKNLFRPIWNIAFWKNVFVFWYSNNITDFKFRNFIIKFLTRGNICTWFYIKRFHFNSAVIFIVVFNNYIIEFINKHVFDIEVMCI